MGEAAAFEGEDVEDTDIEVFDDDDDYQDAFEDFAGAPIEVTTVQGVCDGAPVHVLMPYGLA
eukprot:1925-Chlamydomonas_euryale.AAC.1